jgi:basic membrane protein A
MYRIIPGQSTRWAVVVLAAIVFATALGVSADEEKKSEKPFKVALVYDIGGRGDKSFNDSAYRGLEMAREKLGIEYVVAEPTQGSDREAHLRRFAASDAQLIFGIGFLFTDDITKIARDFPHKEFACVDYTVQPGKTVPPNVVALKFREQEGSFLVGAIAGLLTKTNKVGFVGGAEGPLIRKFEKGYSAGVKYVNPSCDVGVTYAGVSGDAFINPVKGKELALSLYNAGADIIFHASGSTGLGVFKAAEELGKRAIGVDSDQADEAKPGVIITSMLKRVDQTVYNTIELAMKGQFKGGVKEWGLKEGVIGYVYNEKNRDIIGEEVHQRVEALKEKIIRGEIVVPYE